MTDASEIVSGITGGVYKAPFGTALPTDLSALAAEYSALGYLDENGISENWQDSVSRVVAWQNAQVVRSQRTETALTLEFSLMQSSLEVLELFHPGSTMVAAGGINRLDVKPTTAQRLAIVADVIDGDTTIRLAAGNVELTSRGAVPYRNGALTVYPVTLECYPDSAGNVIRKISDSAAWAVA